MPDINTHGLICEFGRHKGQPWTRVPANYLLWMVNTGCRDHEIAAAELKRRGTVKPDLDISGHAIDRASQHLLGHWSRTRTLDEGLHAWLVRKATQARTHGRAIGDRFHFEGIKFVFEEGNHYPVLKTVMLDGK